MREVYYHAHRIMSLGVSGFVVSVFGLVHWKNSKLRGDVIKFIVGDQEKNISFGKLKHETNWEAVLYFTISYTPHILIFVRQCELRPS